jgi:hypothetical protein
MATPVLQFKRGAFSNLPALKAGEPGFTTDKFDLYVGLDNVLANNKFVGSHRYWTRETASLGSGVNLVESTSGTDFITLASPASLSGITTYTFPATPTNGAFLKTNGSGTLEWSTQIDNPTFNNANLTGITTIGDTNLDVNASAVDFAGIVTFSNTTQSTDKDTGAVVVEGGVGIEKNLSVGGATTITGNLFVGGTSEFIGVVTFRGGTINLGDADTDDINVAGEFVSNLIPNVDNTFDIGQGTDPKRWRHANFAGVGTFATGAVADAIQIGISGASEIDTSSGNLTLDSAAGTVIVDDQLSVTGVSTFTGVADFNGGATIDNIQIGISDNNEIDTSTGNLTLDSAGGTVIVDDQLSVTGVSTFTGAIDANGGATIDNIQIGVSGDNEIDTSTGNLTLDSNGGTVTVDDNLNVTSGNTLSQADLTQFDVLVAGAAGAVNDSGGNLTFNSNVLTVVNTIDVTTVEVTNVKAKDGTTSITITDGNGNVGIASDLTVSGKLTVLGSQTEVNTETLLVEDSLIEVGLINSGGSLVPPTADANIDVGLILHYFDTAARKAAVYWDDSVTRVAIASQVSESSSVLTAAAYAALEIGALWVNDCAGQSQVISCTGSERFLENITIDAGSF